MGYQLNEDQALIAEAARSFSDKQLKPNAARWEEEKSLDRSTLRQMAELGFAGLYVRDDVGGSALSRLDAALVFEQLARGCVSTAAFVSIHNMCAWMIDAFGADDLRKRFLPDVTRMQKIISYCLTEPNAGSDAAGLQTTAKMDGDSHYMLNGSKSFISGGGFSDLYLVMARTGGDGPKGVSAFVVENGAPGLSFGKNEKKMGWQAQPTAQVIMEDCRVPAANRIGPEGSGFKFAMMGLDGGRLNISACSLGAASEALERATLYSKDRKQFGKPIADFQATQFKLADMATDLEAGRALLYEAARRLDTKEPDATKFCAMAKRYVTDTGFKVANDALQIHGGYGFTRDFPIERYVRDARIFRIYEGSSEVQRNIIADHLLS